MLWNIVLKNKKGKILLHATTWRISKTTVNVGDHTEQSTYFMISLI